MSEFLVVLISAGSLEEAEKIAMELVTARLAACVNIIPSVTSVYRWEGEIQREQEWLLAAKSHRDLLPELVRRVQSLHSYDLPEVIALPVVDGSQAYLAWLSSEVHGSWHAPG